MKRKIIPLISSNKQQVVDDMFKNSERIFLAPMEEVNDPAFRILCKKAGAKLTYTPLTSPLSPIELVLEDKPILQIFGAKELLKDDASKLKEFMKRYDKKISGWDFNLGCPATTAKNHGFGSYLIDLKVTEKIIKIMRENTKKPLSIKIRKSPLAEEHLMIAEKYCDAIGIHPRTRDQGYSGNPDLSWAQKFKSKANIPIIYSGNVDEFNVDNLLSTFDYVMIGRNAIGHPEIFAKITKNKNFKRDFKEYLKLAEKYNIQWRLIKFQAMQFTKGDKGSRQKRARLIKVQNLEELKELFFEK